MKQNTLADELGIHPSYYSRIERGKVDVSLALLEKIADFYSISLDVLIRKDLEEEPDLIPKK